MKDSMGNAEVPSEEFAMESRAQTKAGVRSGPDAGMQLGMISKRVNEGSGFRTKTAKGLDDKWDKGRPFGSSKGTIATALLISSGSSRAQAALAGKVNKALSCWMSDTDINQEDLRSKNNAKVGASSIHPIILTRLNKTMPASAMNPVGNDIDARIVPTHSFGGPFVREDMPGVRCEVSTAVTG